MSGIFASKIADGPPLSRGLPLGISNPAYTHPPIACAAGNLNLNIHVQFAELGWMIQKTSITVLMVPAFYFEIDCVSSRLTSVKFLEAIKKRKAQPL